MIYIGLPLSGYEVIRLFGCILSKDEMNANLCFENDESKKEFLDKFHTTDDGDEDHSVYCINDHHLQSCITNKTSLGVYYLDKGVYVLGYEFPELRDNLWAPMKSVEENLVSILSRKVDWLNETKRIGMDLSKVKIEHMEDKPEFLFDPDPVLLSWSF